MLGISDIRNSWASVTLDQHRIQEFRSDLLRRHGLVLSDEYRPRYGLWREPPHGCDMRLLVGLDLEVVLVLGGDLVAGS